MEEDVFPHSRARESEAEMQEERRLCYVGITRAMHRLHLSYARRRMVFGQTRYQSASRFLKEIPEEYYHPLCKPPEERGRYDEVDHLDFVSGGGGRVIGGRTSPAPPPRSQPRPDEGKARREMERLLEQRRAAQKPGAYKPGDRVRHATFGDGIVTRSAGSGDDEQVTVIFPGHGEKKLIAGYAKLTKL
jgi:DNA helicase-2/ATP-dependent DNA helicase PcrA